MTEITPEMNVLIIEDSQTTTAHLMASLRMEFPRAAVSAARTLKEAHEIMSLQEASRKPDVILLDLILPDSASAQATLATIPSLVSICREDCEHHNCRIVVITSSTTVSEDDVKRAGAVAMIRKPTIDDPRLGQVDYLIGPELPISLRAALSSIP